MGPETSSVFLLLALSDGKVQCWGIPFHVSMCSSLFKLINRAKSHSFGKKNQFGSDLLLDN